MKQEHEMTPGVLVSGEVLSAGDARARVAVLEAELAELRGRECVPDGYVVVPEKLTELLREMVGLHERRGVVLSVHMGRSEELLAAAPAPVERVEQEAVAMLLIDDATAAESGDWDIEPIPAAIEKLARSGGAALPLYTTPQPAPTACTGKNCGSTDPNLHSADCFAEHEQAIAPTSARKAPPEDPLCGIEYRADGEANFYTLSAATGSWIARIQFNGQFYPHEQERILSAMLGDRNVRYGDGYYDGYWSARKESAAAQDVAGLVEALSELQALRRAYCDSSAGRSDTGAPSHAETIAISELLISLDDNAEDDSREAIFAYADQRASVALDRAIDIVAAHQSGGAK